MSRLPQVTPGPHVIESEGQPNSTGFAIRQIADNYNSAADRQLQANQAMLQAQMERDMAGFEQESLLKRQKADQQFQAAENDKDRVLDEQDMAMRAEQQKAEQSMREREFALDQQTHAEAMKAQQDNQAIQLFQIKSEALANKALTARTNRMRGVAETDGAELDELEARNAELDDFSMAVAFATNPQSRENLMYTTGRQNFGAEFGSFLETHKRVTNDEMARMADNVVGDLSDKPTSGETGPMGVKISQEMPSSGIYDPKTGNLRIDGLVRSALRGSDMSAPAMKALSGWTNAAAAYAKALGSGDVEIDDAALEPLRDAVAMNFQGVQQAIQAGELTQNQMIAFVSMLDEAASKMGTGGDVRTGESEGTAVDLSTSEKSSRLGLGRQLQNIAGALRSSSVKTENGYQPLKGFWETADINRVMKYLDELMLAEQELTSVPNINAESLFGFDADPLEEEFYGLRDQAVKLQKGRAAGERYAKEKVEVGAKAREVGKRVKKKEAEIALDVDAETSPELEALYAELERKLGGNK